MTLSTRLFGEEERSARKDRAPATPAGSDQTATLGEGTSFKGTLTFEGTVRIDGKLEGEIFTKDTLVVGEGAEVSASIQAGVVEIGGTVHGNVTAERKVAIRANGRLYGNISTPSLVIEEGVVFEGSCTMNRGGNEGEQAQAAERDRLFT
jgi:cytoskeletal protein CcmA (bactofilin family)